jgi:hypothetical protein
MLLLVEVTTASCSCVLFDGDWPAGCWPNLGQDARPQRSGGRRQDAANDEQGRQDAAYRVSKSNAEAVDHSRRVPLLSDKPADLVEMDSRADTRTTHICPPALSTMDSHA